MICMHRQRSKPCWVRSETGAGPPDERWRGETNTHSLLTVYSIHGWKAVPSRADPSPTHA